MNNKLSLPLDTQGLYTQIDEVVQRAVDKGDPELAFNLGNDFLKIERISGLAIGRLAFVLKGRWPEFDNPERFEDVAAIYWDINKTHLERLIRTIDMLESKDIPDELQAEFEQKGVKDLIPISAAWQSGYLDKDTVEEWDTLAKAEDDYEIREELRDLKGIEPRKHTLAIWMTREGDLYCKVGSGENKHFGYLNMELADDPEVGKAISRIINNARISTV